MKYAVSVPPFGDSSALVGLAAETELAGWDGFFVWDHLHWTRQAAVEVLDAWVLLGAVATATRRLRIGVLVTPLARRRPWKLAKEIVTLDHLSGGRVVVGAGLGAPVTDDFAAFGEETDPRIRAQRLDEGLALLDRFLRASRSHTRDATTGSTRTSCRVRFSSRGHRSGPPRPRRTDVRCAEPASGTGWCRSTARAGC